MSNVFESDADDALVGQSKSGHGVVGRSAEQAAVVGISEKAQGLWAIGRGKDSAVLAMAEGDSPGVKGISERAQGVWGEAKAKDRSGVVGKSENGPGVTGESKSDRHAGVVGRGPAQGVWGIGRGKDSAVLGMAEGTGVGVKGISERAQGVWGESKSPKHAGVHGKGRLAGFFEGDVEVTGDIRLLGADLAERFEVIGPEPARPGSVMVLAGANQVRVSDTAYDRRVAGVVSGAGDYRPGMVLDSRREAAGQPLALTGKVWVLADADHGPVEVGDFLTTSPTPGYAMRASQPERAVGAVLGKALDCLPRGQQLIRALVTLQ